MNARDERSLQAYYDGELGILSRWHFERRLARSPELQRELGALGWIGGLVREVDAEAPAPDLWDAIARRLPPPGEPAPAAAPAPAGGGWLSLPHPFLRPAGALVAAVAVVAAAVLVWPTGAEVSVGSIRWLDAGERSIMVVEDDSEATIIWLLDAPSEGARRGTEGRSV